MADDVVAGFTLCVAPVAAVSAASAAQILLYGVASMAMARQQLMKMDDQNQKQMLASTQAKTGVLDDEATAGAWKRFSETLSLRDSLSEITTYTSILRRNSMRLKQWAASFRLTVGWSRL